MCQQLLPALKQKFSQLLILNNHNLPTLSLTTAGRQQLAYLIQLLLHQALSAYRHQRRSQPLVFLQFYVQKQYLNIDCCDGASNLSILEKMALQSKILLLRDGVMRSELNLIKQLVQQTWRGQFQILARRGIKGKTIRCQLDLTPIIYSRDS